jgi:hypothetical protein
VCTYTLQVMEAKAHAWLQYGEKSYVDMVVEQLPSIAASLVRFTIHHSTHSSVIGLLS